MAYEALYSLQEALTQILECGYDDDDVTTHHRVKLRIISIHDKAVVLQLNLKDFPEKETIREVANTTQEIIQYLFSPEYLSDCGSDSAVTLRNQLRELAEELESTAGNVVDYCRSNASVNNVTSSSRSALEREDTITMDGSDEDLTLSVGISNRRLRRLAEKIKSSSARDYSPAVGSSSTSALIRKDEDDENDDDDDSPAASWSSRSALLRKDCDEDLIDLPAVSLSSRSALTSKDDVVVGFDDDRLQIMKQLISYNMKLQVIPIVGMGGIGKSTLAKIVYDDIFIRQHFDICAWITISQDNSAESILLKLLASLRGKADGAGRDSSKGIQAVRDIQLEIYKCLKGRRYLIVMDDVWSTESWDCVRNLFPDDGHKSRILLTTRLMNVATYPDPSGPIHTMRFLDDQQSWCLFQQKVFAYQNCPRELGKIITKACGGLPLSIVTMAGLFYGIDTTPKMWQQIVANDGQLAAILSLSYNHLPHHLKACFLYMAGFPEDYDIHVSELIKLWIAEGFLNSSHESISLEEVGEGCLKELVGKSLVLVTSKRNIDDKIKSCRLHSMVRDFCVRQAGQENFLLPVMDYLPNPILRRHFLPQVLENHHRISASWYDLDLKDSKHSSCTRSIICIPQRGYRPKCSVRNFSSLRVLHVLRRKDHSYWELGQVFDLIYLTYLASNIPTSIVPPTISKLQDLQTLIIYRHEVCLPVEIWSLRQLKHLIAFSFDPLPHPQGETLPLENLQTLSLAADFMCSKRMVELIPNIKKLGIFYYEEKFVEGYHLDNLTRLLQLEKLKLETHGSFWPSLSPVFPICLKKLSLSGLQLPWRDMTIVGRLPLLQVLKLRNYASDGEHWETTEGEFVSLRLLLIDESNLLIWTTESSHFPMLEFLMMHRCPNLSEIPYEIGEIPTLQLIEIDDHNQSLLYSAKQIQEEQLDFGNEDIQVRVKHF